MYRGLFSVSVPNSPPKGVMLPSWAYMFLFVDRPTLVLGIRYPPRSRVIVQIYARGVDYAYVCVLAA